MDGPSRFLLLPAGYIQMYDLNLNDTYQQLFSDNKKTVGIDFFIGNKQFIGKGFATLILQKFIQTYCDDVERIIVDPNSKNSGAIHIYKKLGFKKMTSLRIKNELLDIMAYSI